MWFFWECLRCGVYVSLEHPLSSRLWKPPLAKHILALEGTVAVDLDQCAWGKRPVDWGPSQGDVRTLRGTQDLTNNSYLKILQRRCADTAAHHHQQVMGTSSAGSSRAADAASYPEHLAVACAAAAWTAWLRGLSPEPRDLRKVELASLRSAVAMPLPTVTDTSPAIWQLLVARAVGGSSGSGAGGDRGEVGSGASGSGASGSGASGSGAGGGRGSGASGIVESEDFWEEAAHNWARVHTQPRTALLYPPGSHDGPRPDALGPLRTTHLSFRDGTSDTRVHDWRDPRYSKGCLLYTSPSPRDLSTSRMPSSA